MEIAFRQSRPLAVPAPAIDAHGEGVKVSNKVSTKVACSSSASKLVRSQTPALVDALTVPTETARRGASQSWSELERSRHAGRVDAFGRRGIRLDVARQVADLLVVADRENRHAYGSCAQCASLNTPDCRSQQPLMIMHVCWLRRLATP